MILDRGPADFYSISNTAAAGEQPNEEETLAYSSWFADLGFTTSPRLDTGHQFVGSIDRKIRVLDDDSIMEGVTVKIDNQRYVIQKAWHGADPESGMLIADVYLQRMVFTDA